MHHWGLPAQNGSAMRQKKKATAKFERKTTGVDASLAAVRRATAKLGKMSPDEIFSLAVRAGIYTKDGRLTPPYRDDAGPSACRPTD